MDRPFLSFCTTCKGRLHHLKQTLPKNLEAATSWANVEFVLLNYDSQDGLHDWILRNKMDEVLRGRLRYFRLEGAPRFKMAHAKNVAYLLSSGEVICNLDADNFISEPFITELLKLHESKLNLLTHGKKDLWGRVSIRRRDFLSLGGYEESLVGWGVEDLDLIERARDVLKLESKSLHQFDKSIAHSDELRTQFYDCKDVERSRKYNIEQLKRLRGAGVCLANFGESWGVADVIDEATSLTRKTGVFVSESLKVESGVGSPRDGTEWKTPTTTNQTMAFDRKSPIDFTTVVGVDEVHVKELEIAWETWRALRPEILTQPLLLICDNSRTESQWNKRLSFLDHSNRSIKIWRSDATSQRERMLSGLVFGIAKWVSTPWYLKLDTDVVATSKSDWIQSKWFDVDSDGQPPTFVASPWGYTKPADTIDRLDQWADSVSPFNGTSPLRVPRSAQSDRVKHDRIISWCFFGQTDWTQKVAGFTDGQLPVPSQDTFLWYCATRLGSPYRKVRMGKLGWKHCGGVRRMRIQRDKALANYVSHENEKGYREEAAQHIKQPASPTPQRRKLTRGVVYLLTGVSHAVRLIVSLWSLRRFYDGPITLLTTEKESHRIGQACAEDARLGIDHRVIQTPKLRRNRSFVAKASYCLDAPYQANVHLDCDTLVTGDIAALFDVGPDQPLITTQFSDWTTKNGVIQKRIKAWRGLTQDKISQERYSQIVERSLEKQPAINTGVFAYYHRAPILSQWKEWTWIGRKTFICDEIALQILLPQFPHRILDCRYNCSPVYRANQKDVRVWHFHGKKHLRNERPRELWLPSYNEVVSLNLARIQDWTPAKDQRLARFLEEHQDRNVAPPQPQEVEEKYDE